MLCDKAHFSPSSVTAGDESLYLLKAAELMPFNSYRVKFKKKKTQFLFFYFIFIFFVLSISSLVFDCVFQIKPDLLLAV